MFGKIESLLILILIFGIQTLGSRSSSLPGRRPQPVTNPKPPPSLPPASFAKRPLNPTYAGSHIRAPNALRENLPPNFRLSPLSCPRQPSDPTVIAEPPAFDRAIPILPAVPNRGILRRPGNPPVSNVRNVRLVPLRENPNDPQAEPQYPNPITIRRPDTPFPTNTLAGNLKPRGPERISVPFSPNQGAVLPKRVVSLSVNLEQNPQEFGSSSSAEVGGRMSLSSISNRPNLEEQQRSSVSNRRSPLTKNQRQSYQGQPFQLD